MSLGYARKLVQDCLRAYLIKRLCKSQEEKGKRPVPPAEVSPQPPLHTSSSLSYTKAEREAGGSSDYGPKYIFSEEPTLRLNPATLALPSKAVSMPLPDRTVPETRTPTVDRDARGDNDLASSFRPVQSYLVACFRSFENVSSAFPTCESHASTSRAECSSTPRPHQKLPQINWDDLSGWYSAITNFADAWPLISVEISKRPDYTDPGHEYLRVVEQNLLLAQARLRKTLMKVTENLLKRPGGKMTQPEELRFFLILLENPLLHADPQDWENPDGSYGNLPSDPNATPSTGPLSGRHSRILKRIIGLISNLHAGLQNQLAGWWSRHEVERFIKTKNLVSDFLNYRLLRQAEKTHGNNLDTMGGLIPQMPPGFSGADLHDQIRPRKSQKQREREKPNSYTDDWQVRAASRVLSILFDANDPYSPTRMDEPVACSVEKVAGNRSVTKGRFLEMSDFYNSLVDQIDHVGDFTGWEQKSQRFSFCQYPFLLSIWAKMRILEHDVKRQMTTHAREAFLDSIMRQRATNQQLLLNIRRDCLVEDSLKAVGESIGSTTNEAKKALRIRFEGEEGIDSGGLRKEWFLLLVREVFSPDMGELPIA